MRRQEADSLYAVDLVHNAQQARQVRCVRNVLAVPVHDLTEQRHFLDALVRQRTDLGRDIPDGTAPLHAPSKRDDAEGARV